MFADRLQVATPKDVLACPCPLLADDAGDPEFRGLEHAPLFKKLQTQSRKGRGEEACGEIGSLPTQFWNGN